MKLIKKAWIMDISFVREPWFANVLEEPIYADTQGEARSLAFNKLKYEGYDNDETICKDELKFTDVKVKRAPGYDKFETEEGEILTKARIEIREEDRKRREALKQMVVDNPGRYAYIRKGGYYYKDNCCGYTEFQHRAGVYTIQEAVDSSLHCREIDVILIDKDSHNKMIADEIRILQQHYIPDWEYSNPPLEM